MVALKGGRAGHQAHVKRKNVLMGSRSIKKRGFEKGFRMIQFRKMKRRGEGNSKEVELEEVTHSKETVWMKEWSTKVGSDDGRQELERFWCQHEMKEWKFSSGSRWLGSQ